MHTSLTFVQCPPRSPVPKPNLVTCGLSDFRKATGNPPERRQDGMRGLARGVGGHCRGTLRLLGERRSAGTCLGTADAPLVVLSTAPEFLPLFPEGVFGPPENLLVSDKLLVEVDSKHSKHLSTVHSKVN